jgi:hypothetical protein
MMHVHARKQNKGMHINSVNQRAENAMKIHLSHGRRRHVDQVLIVL